MNENCSIFKNGNEIHLTRFLSTVASGRHILVAPSPRELASIVDSHIWKIYGEVLTQRYASSVNSPWSFSRHLDCASCRPEAVAEYYSLPLVIIVENVHTDGTFLEMVASKIRPRFRRHFHGVDPLIRLDQAGGIGEIPKLLERTVARQKASQLRGARVRVLAISDSDARKPGAVSENAREVIKAAQSVAALAHILQKRSIENYFPDDALLAYSAQRADRAHIVKTIVSLQGSARDFYPIKKGLDPKDIDELDIYEPGTPIGHGLGDFAGDLMSNFHHEIRAEALKGRDGIGELEALLDTIEEHL